jgi:hypothetical protein
LTHQHGSGLPAAEALARDHLGTLDRIGGVPITTRNWNTMAPIARALGTRAAGVAWLRTGACMSEMLRFNGSVRREPAIDVWLSAQATGLRAIARNWFIRMRECGDDVRELMHDGCPVACIEDVPFGYVNVFKDHVNVGFFLGAQLRDPRGLLEGTGKRMRHVKVRPGEHLDSLALDALIDAAYSDVKGRLERE